MKKVLVLFLGIAALYAAYVFFYRPNLLINGNFSRSIAGWQFAKKGDAKHVEPEDGDGMAYLSLVPGGEMCQFFLSGLAAGDVCEASFKCRAAKPCGRLTFRLDNHTYATIAVTNSDWQTVRFRFPIFDYADRRSFRLVAGRHSPVDVAEVSLRRSDPFRKAELLALEGTLVTNLVVNGDFRSGLEGWVRSDESNPRSFDKRGVPTLMFAQSSNEVLSVFQTVQLKKDVPYVVCGYALMDDGRMANRTANIRLSYSDNRPRRTELKFSSPNRGIWLKGTQKIVPKSDCELKITLRCEHSQGKEPGKIYFHGIQVYEDDELPSGTDTQPAKQK